MNDNQFPFYREYMGNLLPPAGGAKIARRISQSKHT